jgi:hypothetical protein
MADQRLRCDSSIPEFAGLTLDWADEDYPELREAIVEGWEWVELEPKAWTPCS